MKTTTTLYLEAEIVDMAKKMGVNISKVCNEALTLYIDQKGVQLGFLRLRELELAKAALEKRTENVQNTLNELAVEKVRLESEIKSMQAHIEEAKRAERVAEIMRTIRKVAIENDYDIEFCRIACSELIDDLREYGYNFEGEQFDKHITRLKRIGG